MESKVTFVGRVKKFGNSYYISIPKETKDFLKLEADDLVLTRILVIQKKEEKDES